MNMDEVICCIREIDAGTDNACWVVCAYGDPGFVEVARARELSAQEGSDETFPNLSHEHRLAVAFCRSRTGKTEAAVNGRLCAEAYKLASTKLGELGGNLARAGHRIAELEARSGVAECTETMVSRGADAICGEWNMHRADAVRMVRKALTAILPGQVSGEAVHPDDAAVDAFAASMKEKLAVARSKGRGGWDSDEPGLQQRLSDMLRGHIEKGDPRDVANFAMFLHQRGESILPPTGASDAVVEADEYAAYEKWFAGEQGKAYDGMWKFARAAWLARAALASGPASAGGRGDLVPIGYLNADNEFYFLDLPMENQRAMNCRTVYAQQSGVDAVETVGGDMTDVIAELYFDLASLPIAVSRKWEEVITKRRRELVSGNQEWWALHCPPWPGGISFRTKDEALACIAKSGDAQTYLATWVHQANRVDFTPEQTRALIEQGAQ